MADVVTWNDSEASLTKEAKTYNDFTYDTETDSGILNKVDELDKIIGNISDDVDNIGTKYSELQTLYDKFTDFNDKMDSNKTKLSQNVSSIKNDYSKLLKSINEQVEELQKNDEELMTDLENINDMLGQSDSEDTTDKSNGGSGQGSETTTEEPKQEETPTEEPKEEKQEEQPTAEETPTTETPTDTPATDQPGTDAGFRSSGNGIPAMDENGLVVRTQSQAGQDVINKLYAEIPTHANGTHSGELDSMIDNLSAEECAWVLERIEDKGFGQTGAGYAGQETPESHANFIQEQVIDRFGGDIHNVLKSWGTHSYSGY